MRSLISVVMLAGICGPFADSAFAADLDESLPPPPPPYEERHPVPPIFVPEAVPPVYYRTPRPYPPYDPPPVVRADDEPGYYAEGGYDAPYPREPHPYGEPGFRRDRAAFADERRDHAEPRYGHYLSRQELERRAERWREGEHDRYADQAPLRPNDR